MADWSPRRPLHGAGSAANGLVTRALKDGDAAKIAAAHERKRQAYAEFEAVGDASSGDMFGIKRDVCPQPGQVVIERSGRRADLSGLGVTPRTRRLLKRSCQVSCLRDYPNRSFITTVR